VSMIAKQNIHIYLVDSIRGRLVCKLLIRLLPTAAERVKRTTRAGLFEKSRAPTKFQTQHNFISSPSQQRLADNICKYCQPQRHIAAGDVRSLKNTTVEWTNNVNYFSVCLAHVGTKS
jgi:hypothetical protein